MKRRIYIKNRSFLINFVTIATILLVIILFFVSGMYWLSARALEREIKGVNERTNTELLYRTEEVLEQCNDLAAQIVVNSGVRLFFSSAQPEYLVKNYYKEFAERLNTYGISYIDSIILYAPKQDKLFDGTVSDSGTSLSGLRQNKEHLFDITWTEYLNQEERTTTDIIVRARANTWPYYITLLKQYRAGDLEGVVLVNVDLQDLYEHLMAGREESLQLFLVDDQQRVIARENKKELFSDIGVFEDLQGFRLGESYSEIREGGEERFVYVQSYSEKYGITCVTVNAVHNYMEQMLRMQRLFALGVTLAVFVAIFLAVVYSVRLEKPVQDIRLLLEQAGASKKEDVKYGKNISDIADQIISYIQTNSDLRKELDAKLDLLKDSQMIALQSQINPHFLFNTLNRISLMIESGYSDRKCIVSMISDLSDILRYSLTETKTTSIREEIEYIQKYLSIMKYRYGDFVIRTEVAEELYGYTIPKLVLQPLVENALQHGIAPLISSRECKLDILIKKLTRAWGGEEREFVCIEIVDNGIGIDEKELSKLRQTISKPGNISSEHIGVNNVAQRFYLLFPKEHEIKLDSTLGRGTSIRIVFPAIVFDEWEE